MTLQNTINAIASALDTMEIAEEIAVHNKYCEETNSYDYMIYNMDMFDDFMTGKTPSEIAWDVEGQDFHIRDLYFWFDGKGYPESSDFPTERIDTAEIAEWIVDNEDPLDNAEIEELLDEYLEALEAEDEDDEAVA